jgi:tocopherol O-methyltransferase
VIRPRTAVAPAQVADHYDELDPFYREVWGEHVHHGLWTTGREAPADAVRALVTHVARALALAPGARVLDVGCGYGATARQLAAEHGASVTGITLSPVQHAHARDWRWLPPEGAVRPHFLLGDWMANALPDAAFDAVLAIESTEHMPDLAHALAEMARVVRPGGRVAVCAWIAGDATRPWEDARLLEPICREGRLAGMGTEGDYRTRFAAAGLAVHRVDDLSARVGRTWTLCLQDVARRLATDARYRRYLRDAANRHRAFLVTMLRIRAAYATGAMRYLLFVAERPAG